MIPTSLLTHRWICVLPLAVLLIFVSLYLAAQFLFIECCVSTAVDCKKVEVERLMPTVITDPAMPATAPTAVEWEKQYSGRLTWLFFAFTNVLVCIFAIVVFGLIGMHWVRAGGMIAIIGLSFLVGGVTGAWDTLPLVGPLFKNTIEASALAGISNFTFVNRLIHMVATAATFTMVSVVCAIMFGSEKANDEDKKTKATSKTKEDSLDLLSQKRSHLKIVLYTSTILLISGVLRADQTASWAISFVSAQEFAELARTFFRTVTATLGGFYTLLLAAIYIPAALIIHERARAAIQRENNPKIEAEMSAKLEEEGFKFSFTESFPRILAIAAPLLTGPVAELFKSLANNSNINP